MDIQIVESEEDAKWRRYANEEIRDDDCLHCGTELPNKYSSFCRICAKNRLIDYDRKRLIARKVSHLLRDLNCRVCGCDFQAPRLGRPRVYCGDHREKWQRAEYAKGLQRGYGDVKENEARAKLAALGAPGKDEPNEKG